MTGGQVSFDMDALSQTEKNQGKTTRQHIQVDLPVIEPSEQELNEHETWVKQFEQKHGEPCLFAK
jgi:ribonuclease HI/DNA polymerase-3 subunit epsilon